jgi:hypothetical protein
MKGKLQYISWVFALLTVMTSCDKDKAADTSTNTTSPPPPPPLIGSCDSSNRVRVSAQLVPVGKLSKARGGVAVAAVGSKVLFAGGYGFTRVDIYDVAANSWSQAELSQARGGIAAIAAGNKVFFAGGYVNDGVTDIPYATVDIYNAENNTWTVAHLSEARTYVAAAAVGNKVFFVGGQGAQYAASSTIDIYDLSTGLWSVAHLSEGWMNISAITLNNKIYFAGGYRWLPNLWDVTESNRINIYDDATSSWSTDTLRYPMGALTGVAVAGQIYWAEECLVEIKNVQTVSSTYSSLFASAYWQGVDGQNAVAKDNKIIYFRHNGDKTKWFDIYDVSTKRWSIGEVPINVVLASIISVNNTIYLTGGWIDGDANDQVWKLEF